MPTSHTPQKHTSQKPRNIGGGFVFIGAVFLGICMLMTGFSISGGLKDLNKTLTSKEFSDNNSFNAPSEIVNSEKKYLSEKEAAAYLNISEAKMIDVLTNGGITEYVKTDSGYTISVDVLDSWFENEAYQNRLILSGDSE